MDVADESSGTGETGNASAFVRTFATAFFGYLSVFVLVHLPGYLRELRASETIIGAAIGFGSIAGIASRPFVGRLMDARGRQPALALGGVLLTLASGLHLLIRDPGPFLFLVRALHGIAGGVLFSAVFAVASDLAPERDRTRQLAIFGIAGILPMAVGSLIGDEVHRRFGHEALFGVSALFAFVALGLGLSIPETREAGELVDGKPASMLAPLTTGSLTGLWISGVLFATSVASYFVFVRNFVVGEMLAPVTYFFGPYAVTAVVVRLGFSSLPQRVGESNAIATALLVLAAGLLAVANAHGPYSVVAAGLLCGLGHAFVYPSLLTLFIERSDPAMRGSVVAMFTALMDVGMLFSGYGFGRVADLYGFRVVFGASAAIAIAALAVFVSTAYRPRRA